MGTVPPIPASPRSGWWKRHWKWAVPVLCTLALTIFAGVIVLVISTVFDMVRSSGPYAEGLQRAQANPAAVAALGTPMRAGWFTQGNLEVNGPSGEANLQIPLSGPKGNGQLFVEARKSAGKWNFDTLVLQVDADGSRIDLLNEEKILVPPAAALPTPR